MSNVVYLKKRVINMIRIPVSTSIIKGEQLKLSLEKAKYSIVKKEKGAKSSLEKSKRGLVQGR